MALLKYFRPVNSKTLDNTLPDLNLSLIEVIPSTAGPPTGFWGLGHLQEMRPLTIHVGVIV